MLELDTLAVVANELGQCPQALRLGQRALEALPPASEQARQIQRHVDGFRRSCGAPPAASAAAVPERP